MTADVGSRLRTMRERSGLSQEQLAARIGVSRFAVMRWEADRNPISLDKFLMFCEETGGDAVRTIAALKMQRRKEAAR